MNLKNEDVLENARNILNKVYKIAIVKSNLYLTIDELVTRYPFICKSRIYHMIRYQGLKHIKGKPILINPIDFENFLEERKTIECNTIEHEYNQLYKYITIPKEKRNIV